MNKYFHFSAQYYKSLILSFLMKCRIHHLSKGKDDLKRKRKIFQTNGETDTTL